MLQTVAYDPAERISAELKDYAFWEHMNDTVFLGVKTPDKIEDLILARKADVVLAFSDFGSFAEMDFIKKILSNYPYIYVIIIGSRSDYKDVRRAFLMGAADYLLYDGLEASLRRSLTSVAIGERGAYFSEKIYDKVQSLSKHIFDGGDRVRDIVRDIVETVYADWGENAAACGQIVEKIKLESYKNFVRKKPWLEKFIYRGDYIREIGFDLKSAEETERELYGYYMEVDALFKKYNVIDANKTVYKIGKSVIRQVDEKITLSSIANDVYLNKTYISHIFKKVTGISINDFILDVKADRAKTLLHYPDVSISDIAEILCFCNTGYFRAMFKKHVGITPSEYRKSLKR